MTTPIHAKPKCARNPCSYFFFILCYRKHKSLFHQTDLVSGTARLGDDALELVDLLLGTAEGTEPLLGELTGTLVLAVTEQLNDTALVGGKASNLLDNLTDESGALAEVALGAGDAGLGDAGGGLVAVVQADGKAGAGGSFLGHLCWLLDGGLVGWVVMV
jgi:hypothetical protein